jgi:hypothetical protein
VYEAQVDWFSREIDKLATSNDKNPEDVEFHASTIFSRRTHPWKNLTIDEARGVLKSVLNVVATSYDTARLFACAIHKKSFPHQDPVELAFEDLCQRFDYFLTRRRQQGDQQRGLLRFDEADGVIHGLVHTHAERMTCTCPACLSRRLSAKTPDSSER